MPDPQIVVIAQRYRRKLMAGEVKAIKRMTASYGQLYGHLASDATALQRELDAIRQAGEAVPEWRIVGLQRYKSMMQQTEAEIQRMNKQTLKTISVLQYEAIAAGVDMAEMQLAQLVPAAVNITFNRVPLTALENMVGFLADGSPLKLLLDELGRDTATRIGASLVRGLGMGWNPRKVAKVMREETGMGLTRAMLIARTEQMRAWRVSSIAGMREQGATVKGYRRHAQKDGRTCIACLLMDGTFYRTEEDFTDHPRGRCAVVPYVKSWEELGFSGIPDTNPQWKTGGEWFLEQKPDMQREILGKPVFEAWKSGQIGLDDMKVLHRSPQWGDSWGAASLKGALTLAGGLQP